MAKTRIQLQCSLLFVAGAALTPIEQIHAQSYLYRGDSFVKSTYFVNITQETTTSLRAKELRNGGYETSSGAYIDFNRWYSPKWTDTRISWVTQVTPKLSILWGVSTGEKAEKYTITPSLKLGVHYQTNLSKRSTLSFNASTYIGGKLNEKACIADYGDIGSVQEVNCRLAATTLAPEDTLNYLVQYKPIDTWYIQYTLYF
jgi:hypothetical protein